MQYDMAHLFHRLQIAGIKQFLFLITIAKHNLLQVVVSEKLITKWPYSR